VSGDEIIIAYRTSEVLAAVSIVIMLIPQSGPWALLWQLPPEVGLYASILPLIAHAIFGTSSALAVRTVAAISLMATRAVRRIAVEGKVFPSQPKALTALRQSTRHCAATNLLPILLTGPGSPAQRERKWHHALHLAWA
jgi:MFS superfamily sulfate permease-like transporter